jgi:hypothetical protein
MRAADRALHMWGGIRIWIPAFAGMTRWVC